MSDLRTLTATFRGSGRLEAIYLRPARGVAAMPVATATARLGRGLDGDRSAARAPAPGAGGKRQVTLIQAEHLPLIASWSGLQAIDASALRRNLVISGLNLIAARSPFADQALRLSI